MSESEKVKKRLIIPLDKQAKVGSTIYMLAGLGGHILSMQLLGKTFSDNWRGYGLLHPAFIGAECDTIEDVAELMVNEMVELEPEGPYYICGYSMGGLIAVEICRLLLAKNKVANLILLDARMPTPPPLKPFIVRLPIYLRWYTEKYFAKIFNKGRLSPKKKSIATYKNYDAITKLPKQFKKAFESGRKCLSVYKLTPCAVPAVLIRSETIAWWDNLRYWSSDYGWSNYVDIRGVIPCAGDHLDIIKADQYWQSTGKAIEAAADLLKNSCD